MLRFVLSVLVFLFAFGASAQQMVFSTPQKLSTKAPQFRILGKNKEGIILYNFGRDTDQLHAYSSNMRLKWKRNLNLGDGTSIRKIIIYPETSLVFYFKEVSSKMHYYVQPYDSRFQPKGQTVLVDSIVGNRADVRNMKIVHSTDQSQLVIYTANYAGTDRLQTVSIYHMNDMLEPQWQGNIDLRDVTGKVVLRKLLVSNKGELFLLIEDIAKQRKGEVNSNRFQLHMVDAGRNDAVKLPFSFSRPIFDKLFVEVDDENRKLVAVGLFSDNNKDMSVGYFHHALNLNTGKMIANKYTRYSDDLLYDITGKELKGDNKGLFSFEISDIILRFDGGLVLVAESRYKSVEEIQTPSFVPAAGPTFRTISVMYYNDVLMLSIGPDGENDWTEILRKKQISEDDDGYYSSYAMLNTADRLYLIYNQEIHSKADVNSMAIDPTGSAKRNYLFNTGDQNVVLVPRAGLQVSSTEIIIPSFRKNYLTLLKLSF